MAMDVVDYEIRGAEMQFVEVELDPGEAAVGEAGSMMFMDPSIRMDTVFGDGSGAQGGLLGKLLGRVPLPGASAEYSGLRITGGTSRGRGRGLATVFVEPTERLAAVDAAFAERNEER